MSSFKLILRILMATFGFVLMVIAAPFALLGAFGLALMEASKNIYQKLQLLESAKSVASSFTVTEIQETENDSTLVS